MKQVSIILVAILISYTASQVFSQEKLTYRDKEAIFIPEAYVAKKVILNNGKNFNGIFRINYQSANNCISIEGKKYRINEHRKSTHYRNSDYHNLFLVTEIVPEYSKREPQQFVIGHHSFFNEGTSVCFETAIYDSNDEHYATFRGSSYHLKKGSDGNPYCYDCLPDIYKKL